MSKTAPGQHEAAPYYAICASSIRYLTGKMCSISLYYEHTTLIVNSYLIHHVIYLFTEGPTAFSITVQCCPLNIRRVMYVNNLLRFRLVDNLHLSRLICENTVINN